jgi:hypothetical protein
MITKIPRIGLKIGALAAVLAMAAPAIAQNHGGGGHFGGGGGHMSGGHSFSGGHGAVSHFNGGVAHGFSGTSHFAPGAHYGYAGGYGHGGYYGGGWHGGWGGGWGGGWRGGYWGGGWWHGGFWPRAYYGLGFSWFLPVLPLAYATYWWDGMPYYYANNVYYTWNPTYDGYTVTDPPPVNADADGAAPPPSDGGAQAQPPMPPPSAGAPGDQVFMYPKNGQSDAQMATDRSECQQWAASQAGGSGSSDYHRAMSACAEARGYSAR